MMIDKKKWQAISWEFALTGKNPSLVHTELYTDTHK